MKKIYDCSKDTLEHIIKVGKYLDIIIDEIRNYKKVELNDNINDITVVDLLYLLLYGEELPFDNELINNIYNNSIGYLYLDEEDENYIPQDMRFEKYISEVLVFINGNKIIKMNIFSIFKTLFL